MRTFTKLGYHGFPDFHNSVYMVAACFIIYCFSYFYFPTFFPTKVIYLFIYDKNLLIYFYKYFEVENIFSYYIFYSPDVKYDSWNYIKAISYFF